VSSSEGSWRTKLFQARPTTERVFLISIPHSRPLSGCATYKYKHHHYHHHYLLLRTHRRRRIPSSPPSHRRRFASDMAETVSDPTDWQDTKLPFISPLDAALRCEVCKEFYTAPMITTCSHTFCSLCIRKALHNDGKCPLCRSPGQECHLRKNTTVQDLLDAFVGCREKLFEFATKEAAPIPWVEDESTPSSSQPSVRPRRSRRRAAAYMAESDDDDDPQPVEPAPPPGSCPRPYYQSPMLMFTR
jgi:hypothetical protein